jgi:hypothetical protein
MDSRLGNYVTNVAAAVSGHEGFSSSHPDAAALYGISITIIFIYMIFIALFSIGAATLSYNYNVSIGTSGTMTVVYVILSFLFSSFYYPYYALALNPLAVKAKAQKGARH